MLLTLISSGPRSYTCGAMDDKGKLLPEGTELYEKGKVYDIPTEKALVLLTHRNPVGTGDEVVEVFTIGTLQKTGPSPSEIQARSFIDRLASMPPEALERMERMMGRAFEDEAASRADAASFVAPPGPSEKDFRDLEAELERTRAQLQESQAAAAVVADDDGKPKEAGEKAPEASEPGKKKKKSMADLL